jgi:hypothetical protein
MSAEPRTYRNQFPVVFHPPVALVDALESAGWVDTSWGNDVNPSWQRGEWTLYVSPVNVDDREDVSHPRFALFREAGNEWVEGEALPAWACEHA